MHLVLRPTVTEGNNIFSNSRTSPLPSSTLNIPQQPPVSAGNPIPPRSSTPGSSLSPPPLPHPLANLYQYQQALYNQELAHLHNQNNELQQQLLPSMQRLHELQHQAQRVHQELIAQQQRNRELFANGPGAQTGIQPAIGTSNPPGVAQIPNQLALPSIGMGQRPVPGMAAFQNIVGQIQRDRAAMGLNGAQQDNITTASPHIGALRNTPRSMSPLRQPDQTRTFRQEGIGPNGERWNVTVNQTTTIIPSVNSQNQTSQDAQRVRDVHNILRSADRQSRPTTISTPDHSNPMTPSVSHDPRRSPSLNVPPFELPFSRLASQNTASSATAQQPEVSAYSTSGTTTPQNAMVYILSSPTGPRALLINGPEAFFTPRATNHRSSPLPAPQNPLQAHLDAALGLPELRQRSQGRAQRHADRVAARAAGANGAPNVQGAPAGQRPRGQAADNAIVQMLPHIWLLIRLAGFVYFFASGDSSWWRWTTVVGLAILVFLINTGLITGIADEVWGPIRRHLEGLLPLAAPNVPAAAPAPVGAPAEGPQNRTLGQPEVAGNGTQAQPAGQNFARGMPEPADVAARLLEQHQRANTTWFRTQIRRAEHAAILFLASLIPGVGERHIEARAAEENLVAETQRQRRREAETAASVAVVESNQSNETQVGGAETGSESASSQPVYADERNARVADSNEGGSSSGRVVVEN